MLFSRFKSVTLVELLVSLSLLGVLILGIYNIVVFSTYHHASSDRLARLQNDVSRCLEHMTKTAGKAVGNLVVGSVVNTGTSVLSVFIDQNFSGKKDAGDVWVSYQLIGNTLRYYADCGGTGSPVCTTYESLADKFTGFVSSAGAANYLDITLTSRWNPGAAVASDNPEVSMQTTIILPGVSTH